MAEFLTESEANNKYASKGVANAGLALGIVGTALSALGPRGILGGNGILGFGGGGYGDAAAMTAAGIATGAGMTELAKREVNDHDYCLVKEGQIQVDALRDQMFARERDIREKVDIYRQSAIDDNRINAEIASVKEYATNGIVDAYKANNAQFRALEREVGDNKLSAYKDLSDLYRVTAVSDKNLELQIERNREVDQKEKFGLYKDLSSQTNRLAYETMKQSYEDRIAGMAQVGALAARVSELEKKSAVTAAQLPLMFSLAESHSNNALQRAVCRKIDGNLTIAPYQISTPCSNNDMPFPFFGGNSNPCTPGV